MVELTACADGGCHRCAEFLWGLHADMAENGMATPEPLRSWVVARLRRVEGGEDAAGALGVKRPAHRPRDLGREVVEFDLARAVFFLVEHGMSKTAAAEEVAVEFGEWLGRSIQPTDVARAYRRMLPDLLERDENGACKLWLGWERFGPIARRLRQIAREQK